MINLLDILKEAKESIEDFAGTRLKGAEKIADTTLKDVPPIEQDIIVIIQDHVGKQIIGLVKLGKIIKFDLK